MYSPLPDSRALEAGIIEDAQHSRLSRVHDNVRNLLRASVFGSVHSSPAASPKQPYNQQCLQSPPPPICQTRQPDQPAVAPSPTDTATSTTSSSSDIPGVLFPATNYDQVVLPTAHHQSTVYNARAVTALSHPDISDPSLALFLQQKTEDRQKRAWKRPRSGSSRSSKSKSSANNGKWIICLLSGLALVALVGTYLTLATTSESVSPVLHILFVLAILLTLIAFVHSLVRLCFLSRSCGKRNIYVLPVPQSRRRRQRRHHRHAHQQDHQRTAIPSADDQPDHYVPATPIPVSVTDPEEVRPDTREAQPSAAVHQTPDVWYKNVDVPNPPPAYGKWRGSVRADPKLLHWQAVPSPTDSDIPSPTYNESQGDRSRAPPSYRTRGSPARTRQERGVTGETAQAQTHEPEIFEARGVGAAI